MEINITIVKELLYFFPPPPPHPSVFFSQHSTPTKPTPLTAYCLRSSHLVPHFVSSPVNSQVLDSAVFLFRDYTSCGVTLSCVPLALWVSTWSGLIPTRTT